MKGRKPKPEVGWKSLKNHEEDIQKMLRAGLALGAEAPRDAEPPPLKTITGRPVEEAPDDPWKHRAKGMRCDTCIWFVLKATGHEASPSRRLGRCRRHAPTFNGWPSVFASDWCGDHRLSEDRT